MPITFGILVDSYTNSKVGKEKNDTLQWSLEIAIQPSQPIQPFLAKLAEISESHHMISISLFPTIACTMVATPVATSPSVCSKLVFFKKT